MLDIYKASAGSGKTYTLTLEYIKLLFHDPKNYRKTLAVTFTNNACGEMKNRILRALYLLSFKDDADYIKELQAEKFNGKTLKKEEIQATAKKIYKDILHNYSFFYIETIDAFTQNVIRNFAKDLGLPPKFTLELRQNEILETIVKNLLINSLDNEDLHKILVDFAYEDIENSTTTDIKKEVKNESNKFFKELYQEVMTDNPRSNEEIKENITKLSLFFEKLEQTKKNTKKQAQIVSDEIELALKKANLDVSFFNAPIRDTLNINELFKSGKLNEKVFSPIDCCSKSKKDNHLEELTELYNNGVLQKLKKIQDLVIEYNTAKKILEHKKGVILSQYIQNELDTYCKEENTFFLAFANKFLKSIINGSDTPFVYEKIGQTIENIMVDEFQDTSKMQWENFKPIVLNLLSSLKKALIIGDVKQSIYRFRNGNWQLLHNLEHDSELLPYINEETIDKLNVNYRSKKNIVQFNNFFFQHYSKKIDKNFNSYYGTNNDTITHIYENCCQQVGKGDGGCVEIQIFDGKADDAQEELNKALVEKVVSLLQLGRKPDDIVFLCYKNDEISELVNLFNEKKNEYPQYAPYFSIMSKEALLLNNSLAVQFIICYLKRLNVNETSKDAQFLDSFLTYTFNTLHKTGFETFAKILELPEYALKPIVQNMSIFETCEHIIENFKLQTLPEETAFLTDFQNIVYSYSKNNNTSISSFLEHWDEIKEKTYLQQAQAHGCMSAATIHSSKGLEYPVVIMPRFIKGKYLQRTVLYKTNFDDLKLVDLQGDLRQTTLRDEYIEEQYNVEIDDTNALYVACTRPKEELYIFDRSSSGKETFRTILLGKTEKEKKSSKKDQEPPESISPSDFIDKYHDWFQGNPDLDTIEISGNCFRLGEPKPSKATESNDTIVTQNFSSYTIPKLVNNGVENDIEIKLVPEKNSKHFIEMLDQPQTEREHGLLMHKILEHINTVADIERYVNQYCPPELFPMAEKQEIAEKLRQKITDKHVAHWFDDSWDHILTEQPLLQQNGVEKRPDRMLIKGNDVTIIDYKFGKEQPESYKKQVKEYMNILSQMGYTAQGFIWYVELDDIVTVA